jgi:hypothetical protein
VSAIAILRQHKSAFLRLRAEDKNKAGTPIAPALKALQSWSSREPFRSLPISANTPAELALLIVYVTPFWMTVKDPVAVAKRMSAVKFEGFVGSDEPGRKC